MTAIAGCWSFGGRPDPDEACRRMLAAQRIYGPHDRREWSGPSIAMGRCLYRLLPEDAHDRQPLHGADGRLTLVADVRLDNRDELAAALRLERAAALCDAQILLAALERWREDAIARLAGDFAFALWDHAGQKLLLARDALGQRPLHYHRGRDFFAFATMPKGLHALPEVPHAPDEQAVAEFVTLLPAAGSRSFFAGIERVEPGHFVTVTRGGIAACRHWRPDSRAVASPRGGDYAEGLRDRLDEATRSRLRGSSGAVATHLSAGFDSAAVTATAARLLAPGGGKVAAFTAVPRKGYDGPVPPGRFGDEGPLAAAAAAMHANVEHVLVAGRQRSPLDDLDRNFFLFDQPLLNLCNMVWASAINDAARERKLAVMLTGQMGNQTMSYSGIERISELLRAGRISELWHESSRLVSGRTLTWAGVAGQAFGGFVPPGLWRLLSAWRGQAARDVRKYTAIRSERFEELELERLARRRRLDFAYRPRRNGFETRLWVLQRVDPGNFNKGILAGWGIDQRDPTADTRLVEYCLSVPMDQYLRDGELRSLARRALGDRLPAALLEERCKGYQAADWHEGLEAGRAELAGEIERLESCGPAARTLDLGRLKGLVADWPASGWERREIVDGYRLALVRGVSAGHFLRKASGSNA